MEYIIAHLSSMERDPAIASREAALSKLRELGVADFAWVLWQMPMADLPKLSSLLPPMASSEVQAEWTGDTGHVLLAKSIGFIRSVAAEYPDLRGESLRNKKILDFGCGYGRFLRMAMFYSNDVWGVDPWPQSVQTCVDAGLSDRVVLSENLPQSLPVDADFDFILSFSVFTHLSERAARTALKAMRRHIKKGGIVCITVRPIEYWRQVHGNRSKDWLASKEADHRERGFAFFAHDREPVDGDVTYGDTSMTSRMAGSSRGRLENRRHRPKHR